MFQILINSNKMSSVKSFLKRFLKNKILKVKTYLSTTVYISLIKEKFFCIFKTSVYFR